jgi:hypothetical protein
MLNLYYRGQSSKHIFSLVLIKKMKFETVNIKDILIYTFL